MLEALTSKMNHKIEYIEKVFDFYFKGKFSEQYEDLNGFIDTWHKNAQVFSKLSLGKDLPEKEKFDLFTPIEATRFFIEASKSVPGYEDDIFDFSAYEMPNSFKYFWSQ